MGLASGCEPVLKLPDAVRHIVRREIFLYNDRCCHNIITYDSAGNAVHFDSFIVKASDGEYRVVRNHKIHGLYMLSNVYSYVLFYVYGECINSFSFLK